MPLKLALEDSPPLDRKVWVAAALAVLASDGIDHVRVELLARQLGITKGSFYHHFRDRDDLHSAMLQSWRQGEVHDIMADLDKIADPRERFHGVLRVSLEDRRTHFELDVALRLWARRDDRVRALLEEVDAQRVAFIENILVECGLPKPIAAVRAALAYALLRTSDAGRHPDFLLQCEQFLLSPCSPD